jgi:hypothetical protein
MYLFGPMDFQSLLEMHTALHKNSTSHAFCFVGNVFCLLKLHFLSLKITKTHIIKNIELMIHACVEY